VARGREDGGKGGRGRGRDGVMGGSRGNRVRGGEFEEGQGG